MKFFIGNYYVKVKDKQYRILPTVNTILRLRDEPKSFRTQYHIQNESQITKNQEVVENNGRLEN